MRYGILRSVNILAAVLLLTGAMAQGALTRPAAGTDEAYNYMSRLTRAMEQIRRHYVEEDRVGYEDLLRGALRGMLQTLDEHSSYLDPDSLSALRDDAAGEFGGVGIVVGLRDGQLIVISPIEDTPAWRAGLLPGDRILRIDGESTENWSLPDAVSRMRGTPGTGVSIGIARPGESAEIPIDLIRTVIEVATVKEERLLDNGIGYVRILQFSDKTAEMLEASLGRLEAAGMQALILDLRNNPGGLLQSAVDISQIFLPSGFLIVSTEGRDAASKIQYQSRRRRPKRYPLAILINAGSASASEVVSGALQDHGRAVLVGEKTFGKGSVQTIVPLDDESALRLTTAKYLTPLRRVIHGYGIEPDILVPLTSAALRDIYQSRESVRLPGTPPAKVPEDLQFNRAAEALRAVLILRARK